MPIHNFLCECGEITQELFGLKEEKIAPECEVCGGKTEWTMQAKHTRACGDKERVSSALGVHPSQIADGSVFKMHPGAVFNSRGDMITKNLTEHKQRLRDRGWVDKNSFS
jgi:hypothetical protein